MPRTPVRNKKPKKSSTKRKPRKSQSVGWRSHPTAPPDYAQPPLPERMSNVRAIDVPDAIDAVYDDLDDGGADDGDEDFDPGHMVGGPDLPTFGDNDEAMYEGARDLFEGVYSKGEITEYIDELADYFDMDAHDLFDMYYGYSEAA